MSPQAAFKRAWSELRAGKGYTALNAPRARMAAIESLRMRLERDETALARQRIAYGDRK